MNIRKKLADYFLKKPYVYNAVLEQADLKAFTKKPERKIFIKTVIGFILILFSYIIGWPAVIFLGIISYSLRQPLLVIIGGPVVYGFSHLVFWAGMYLAGVHYTKIFLRWAVRIGFEKLAGKDKIDSLKNKRKNEPQSPDM
jgi:hypothetical protein